MAGAKSSDEYKLKLTGVGISVERPIGESVARRILALVMGGEQSLEKPRIGPEPSLASEDPPENTTPKAFMASKRPTTDMERITCLAYFLTHLRQTTVYKTKDLTDLNVEAAGQKLSNPSATARNAVANGLLSLAGGARKQITARGEALVKAMPDREAVQAALAAHPIRRPRKKRTPRKSR